MVTLLPFRFEASRCFTAMLNWRYGYVSCEWNSNEVTSALEQPSAISILCSWAFLESIFSESCGCKYMFPWSWSLAFPSPLFGPPPSHSWRRKSGSLFGSSIAIDCCPLSFCGFSYHEQKNRVDIVLIVKGKHFYNNLISHIWYLCFAYHE